MLLLPWRSHGNYGKLEHFVLQRTLAWRPHLVCACSLPASSMVGPASVPGKHGMAWHA